MAEHYETSPAQPNDSTYYEYKYPYVLPKDDVLELLGEEHDKNLTPLENCFVRWFLQTGSAKMAVNNLIHPAYPFDDKTFSGARIMSRPTVKDVIKKIRKQCPYLRLYNADYMAEILHDEVQYLRYRHRTVRFYDPKGINLLHYNGKKSIHEEETSDIDLLLRCLELIQKFTTTAKVPDEADTDGKQSDASGSVDRLIAETTRLISRAKVDADGRVGQGT